MKTSRGRLLSEVDKKSIRGAAGLWLDFSLILEDLQYLKSNNASSLLYAVDNQLCTIHILPTEENLSNISTHPNFSLDESTSKLTVRMSGLATATLKEIFSGVYKNNIGFVEPQVQELMVSIHNWIDECKNNKGLSNSRSDNLTSALPPEVSALIDQNIENKGEDTKLVEELLQKMQEHSPQLLNLYLGKPPPLIQKISTMAKHIEADRIGSIGNSVNNNARKEEPLTFTEEYWYKELAKRKSKRKSAVSKFVDASTLAEIYRLNSHGLQKKMGQQQERILLLTGDKAITEAANAFRYLCNDDLALQDHFVRSPRQLSEFYQLGMIFQDRDKHFNRINLETKLIFEQLNYLFYVLYRPMTYGSDLEVSRKQMVWYLSMDSFEVERYAGEDGRKLLDRFNRLRISNKLAGVLNISLRKARELWKERIRISELIASQDLQIKHDGRVKRLKNLMIDYEKGLETRLHKVNNSLSNSHSYLEVFSERTIRKNDAITAFQAVLQATTLDVPQYNSWHRVPPLLREQHEDRTAEYVSIVKAIFDATTEQEEFLANESLFRLLDPNNTNLGVLYLALSYILGYGDQWSPAKRQCEQALKQIDANEGWRGLSAHYFMAQIYRHGNFKDRRKSFQRALDHLESAREIAIDEKDSARLIRRIESEWIAQTVSYYEYCVLISKGSTENPGFHESATNSLQDAVKIIHNNMESMLTKEWETENDLRLKSQFFTYACDIFVFWDCLHIGTLDDKFMNDRLLQSAYNGLNRVLEIRGGKNNVSYYVQIVSVLCDYYVPNKENSLNETIKYIEMLLRINTDNNKEYPLWSIDRERLHLILSKLYIDRDAL